MLIQIFLVIFFVFAMVKVIGRWRGGELSARAAVLWILFWLAGVVVVILPHSTSYFANLLGVGRGVDLAVYLSVALLFFAVFRLTVRIERLNKDITKLTRRTALEEKELPLSNSPLIKGRENL
ncbi:DUF2304 domain-containing protein [Patescibacteria group bacterium]|nr:MAG: DUF2304 domain-containing protein [Patescibacteria group bacterium]